MKKFFMFSFMVFLLVLGLAASQSSRVQLRTLDTAGATSGQAITYNGSSATWGTPTITKANVGLGNVDNTSDVNKPVSTATQTALNLKANLASPTFTGTPAVPTASAGTATTQIASTAFVNNALQTANNTIKGNILGFTAIQQDLTGAQVATLLPIFTASANGLVPSYTTATGKILSDGGWITPSGGGSVTSVSVTGTNGFGGTVATPSSTPAITITTSVNGIAKGNGTGLTAASSGTDYAPGTSGNTTGLVISTTGTGALSSYTGAACTNSFTRGISTVGALTCNQISLTADVTGITPIANGGTNTNATPTAGGVVYGTGTAQAYTTAGGAGAVLTANGSSAPTWSTNAPNAANLAVTNSGGVNANADRGVGLRPLVSSTGATNFPTVPGAAFEVRRASGSTSDVGTFQISAQNDDGLNTAYYRKVTGYSGGDTWGAWRQFFFTDSTLAATQLPPTAVRTDQGNTYSAGVQNFAAASSLTVPIAAGAAPTANGQLAYDSTSNALETAINGVNKTVAMTDSNITGTAAGLSSNIAESQVTNLVTDLAGKLPATITSATTGQYTRYNGTTWVNSVIQAADVPTLNQNTTGTAANLTSMTTNTILCAPGSTTPTNCTGTQATALLDLASSSLKGLMSNADKAKLDKHEAAEASVASATTTDLGAASSWSVQITGTTAITSFGTAPAGTLRFVRFAGVLTLTHNATSLILPGAANITTAANDTLTALSLGSGNWLVYEYQRASGQALLFPATTCTNQFLRSVATTGLGTCQTVANGDMSTMPTLTLKGNNTASATVPTDLTVAQVQAMITPMLAKSTTAASAAINTTETYIAPTTFSVPANSLVAGDSFRITAYGTNTSTVAGANTFTPRFGTAGTTADTALTAFASTSAASGTDIPFEVVITCTVRAIGASGSMYCYGKLSNSGTTGISTTSSAINTGGAVTVNTTVANILGLSLATAATTTTDTMQAVIVEKVR